MHSYKNVVLIVVFTWARDTANVNRIRKLYEPFFKRVVFYSQAIENGSTDQSIENIHYLDIRNGWNVIRVFDHFRKTYTAEIDMLDGLFYTMDDNIINLNILKFYKPDKILHLFNNPVWTTAIPAHPHNHNEMMDIDIHTGWHWRQEYKDYFKLLLKDPEFNVAKYGTKCRGQLGDYFYLPIKYLSEAFNLFRLFDKYDIMLEIAIPTIIRMIEPNEENYHTFKTIELWGGYRDAMFHKELVYDIFLRQLNLFVHPIKFNQNLESLDWLDAIFSCPRQSDKCVVITTINGITNAIQKHINSEYDVIIVGDIKTPNVFALESPPNNYYEKTDAVKQTLLEKRCVYLDVALQNSLFDNLSKLIPFNHYGRKNLGYLYAILQGYTIIYETDDDNIPNKDFDRFPTDVVELEDTSNVWINIFKYFTNGAHIWPRGYPLSLVKSKPIFITNKTDISPSIITGLVEGDPDVDAIFRLTQISEVDWKKDTAVIISNKNVCVFNTQNTFWTDPSIFASMLLPCSVTFRYCDILKGIITNIVLKWTNKRLMYTSPNVVQIRNEHNLIKDLESEQPMYISNENILDFIENDITDNDTIKSILRKIYNNLYVKKIIQKADLDILEEWLNYF
jgi:hypothetical protein